MGCSCCKFYLDDYRQNFQFSIENNKNLINSKKKVDNQEYKIISEELQIIGEKHIDDRPYSMTSEKMKFLINRMENTNAKFKNQLV